MFSIHYTYISHWIVAVTVSLLQYHWCLVYIIFSQLVKVSL